MKKAKLPGGPGPKQHCWHATGSGTVNGMGTGGYDEYRCCWCGTRGVRHWSLVQESVTGHGQWHTIPARDVDLAVSVNFGEPTECSVEHENSHR